MYMQVLAAEGIEVRQNDARVPMVSDNLGTRL